MIIPTYKREKSTVRIAIESVINQTLEATQYEIIVVDDNSEDLLFRNSIKELIDDIKLTNPAYRIKLIANEKNEGGSISRNIGVKESQCKYVTFLDDDDIYLENKLEKQLSYIEEGQLDMIFSNLLIYKEDKLIDRRKYNNITSFDNQNLLKYHLTNHITGTPTFMLKRQRFNEIGGFPDVNMGQEFHLMVEVIKSELKIGYLNEDLVIAYIHDGERISAGKNKINGEKKLIKFKEEHFSLLTKLEIRFIYMRHYAILAYYNLKSGNYLQFLNETLKSFKSYPSEFIKEVYKRIVKRWDVKNGKISH